MFPGSFNPLHQAHLEMARIAAEKTARPVWFELSVTNADKPAMEYEDVVRRAGAGFGPFGLLLTASPTFQEKANLFPGATFVIGEDTFMRIKQSRFYGPESAAIPALRKIVDRGCRFLVFHRKHSNIERTQANSLADEILKPICTFVPREEFTMDISSTDLRSRPKDSG